MKKRSAAWLLSVLLMMASLSSNTDAAGLDRTSPFTGQYLLAINTGTDVTTTQYTGTIYGEASDANNRMLSVETAVGTQDGMPIVGVSEADGREIYQVDPSEKLKKMQKPKTIGQNMLPQTELNSILTEYVVGNTDYFYTADLVQYLYVSKQFTLKYVGSNCTVWFETGSDVSLTDTQINDLGTTYDSYIYTNMTANFGTGYDRNGDGKLTILLYDIKDGYSASSPSYIAGYFDSYDLSGTGQASNEMDVIHVDTYPAMSTKASPNTAKSKSTIAHENQHLINYSYSLLNGLDDMPLWLNEGLSMAAQHMLYGAQTSRISTYSSSTAIGNGRSVFDWTNTADPLPSYAQAYVFVQYLRTQTMNFSGGGTAIYKDMIQSTNRTSTVVEDEMRKFYSTITMADILTGFKIATFLKESSGPYGFMGETAFNALAPQLFTGSSANLKGGGAVVRQVSSYIAPSGGNGVQYVGFGASAVAKPNASVACGAVEKGTVVGLSSATSGAAIRYTLDGSLPSPVNGMLYSEAIVLSADAQLRAIAYQSGAVESEIMAVDYTIIPHIIGVAAPAGAVIGSNTITANQTSDTSEITVDVTPDDNATWALYRDAACSQEIADKVMGLAVGSNTAYIKVTAQNGLTEKIYTLSVQVVWAPPQVTADDVANVINGINLTTMEYAVSTDGGATYGAYCSEPDPVLGGGKTVKVRIKADGANAAGLDKTLHFTINYGDINGDGTIDISDVIMAAEIAVGQTQGYTEQQILRADVSGEGVLTVDISDVVLIAEHAVGSGGALFPVELL